MADNTKDSVYDEVVFKIIGDLQRVTLVNKESLKSVFLGNFRNFLEQMFYRASLKNYPSLDTGYNWSSNARLVYEAYE